MLVLFIEHAFWYCKTINVHLHGKKKSYWPGQDKGVWYDNLTKQALLGVIRNTSSNILLKKLSFNFRASVTFKNLTFISKILLEYPTIIS